MRGKKDGEVDSGNLRKRSESGRVDVANRREALRHVNDRVREGHVGIQNEDRSTPHCFLNNSWVAIGVLFRPQSEPSRHRANVVALSVIDPEVPWFHRQRAGMRHTRSIYFQFSAANKSPMAKSNPPVHGLGMQRGKRSWYGHIEMPGTIDAGMLCLMPKARLTSGLCGTSSLDHC